MAGSRDTRRARERGKAEILQEQRDRYKNEAEKMSRERRDTEDKVRKLCESILCADTEEVNATDQGEKLWSRMTVEELLRRTMDSYIRQRKIGTGRLQGLIKKNGQLLDQLQDKDESIQSLKDQIMRGGASSPEDIEAQLEQERKDKKTEERKKSLEAALRSSPTPVSFVRADENDLETASELDLYGELEEDVVTSIPVETAIPSSFSKGEKARKGERERKAKLLHEEDLVPIIEGLSEPELYIMGVVGRTGKSRYQEIVADDKAAENFTTGALHGAAKDLVNKGILDMQKFFVPIWRQNAYYELTPKGRRVYFAKFKQEAEKSEMSRILSEHTTYEHGYGIKSFAEKLRENGEFKVVDEFTRKKPVKIAGGVSYIPDIICGTLDGKTYYCEYETGSTVQGEFNSKLSKMVQVTDIISIATPEHKSCLHVRDQVDKWISNRGEKSLKGVEVRVSPVLQLVTKGRDFIPSKNWMYRKRIGADKEWIVNN